MDIDEIDITKLEPELRRAVELLIEIGIIAAEAGTDEIDIDKDTLRFLNNIMPQIEALTSTLH